MKNWLIRPGLGTIDSLIGVVHFGLSRWKPYRRKKKLYPYVSRRETIRKKEETVSIEMESYIVDVTEGAAFLNKKRKVDDGMEGMEGSSRSVACVPTTII